jgi:hypothetical protein
VVSQLHWHAVEQQLRDILGVSERADLAGALLSLRARIDSLEAENGQLRALLASARLLSSEAARVGMADPSHSIFASNFQKLINCVACRTHLGANGFLIEACASVANETGRPISQVLTDYLSLFHDRQHIHSVDDAEPHHLYAARIPG